MIARKSLNPQWTFARAFFRMRARQNHNGEYLKPPKSLRGYWERHDEYMDGQQSKVIGKDSSRSPFCRVPETLTTSQTTHYALHKQFPQVRVREGDVKPCFARWSHFAAVVTAFFCLEFAALTRVSVVKTDAFVDPAVLRTEGAQTL